MSARTATLLCAMVACRGDAPVQQDDSPTVDPTLYLEPRSINFGSVKLGETATASVTLKNGGRESIDVDGLVSSTDALVVDDTDLFRLAPGEEQVRTLQWTPVTTETLDTQIGVFVVSSPPRTIVLPVSGTPEFGVLDAPVGTWNLGSVPVGCEREFVFHVSNRGPGDVTLESVTLSGPDEFTLRADWTGNSSFFQRDSPTAGVLSPYESVDFIVTFVPTTVGVHSEAKLHIESDAAQPVADPTLMALAVEPPLSVSLSWEVPPRPTALTSVIDVNADVAPYLHDAFPSFFDVLRSSPLPFRVAIIGTMNETGDLDPSVAGPYAYIDETLSAAQTDEAIDSMLDGIAGDEDRGLALLESAIEEHQDWLLDDDWQSSTLHLTVVNVDEEQSPAPASYYVHQYEEHKDDPAHLVVNGIAGHPPAGCFDGAGAGSALSSAALLDATLQTDGVFLSICDDWSTNLGLLATHMIQPMFPLDDPPLDSNITVTIDGKEIDSGWVYDPESNAIRFDDDTYPAEGSIVGVDYGIGLVCE
jgi:hypothetical protein